jgi:hypothetical protein
VGKTVTSAAEEWRSTNSQATLVVSLIRFPTSVPGATSSVASAADGSCNSEGGTAGAEPDPAIAGSEEALCNGGGEGLQTGGTAIAFVRNNTLAIVAGFGFILRGDVETAATAENGLIPTDGIAEPSSLSAALIIGIVAAVLVIGLIVLVAVRQRKAGATSLAIAGGVWAGAPPPGSGPWPGPQPGGWTPPPAGGWPPSQPGTDTRAWAASPAGTGWPPPAATGSQQPGPDDEQTPATFTPYRPPTARDDALRAGWDRPTDAPPPPSQVAGPSGEGIPPPGWYPVGGSAYEQRYSDGVAWISYKRWDGTAWVEVG